LESHFFLQTIRDDEQFGAVPNAVEDNEIELLESHNVGDDDIELVAEFAPNFLGVNGFHQQNNHYGYGAVAHGPVLEGLIRAITVDEIIDAVDEILDGLDGSFITMSEMLDDDEDVWGVCRQAWASQRRNDSNSQ
ncbi:hypothetical protein COOONC_03042, partial [Cooperia oncophora]